METLSQNNTRNAQVVRLVQSALLPAEVLSFQTHTPSQTVVELESTFQRYNFLLR